MLGTESFKLTDLYSPWLTILILREEDIEADVGDFNPVKWEGGVQSVPSNRLSAVINTANIRIHIMVVDSIK